MSKVVRLRIKGKRNLARGRKWRKSGHRCFGKKRWDPKCGRAVKEG